MCCQQVQAGAEDGEYDFDVVAVLAQQLTRREQDVLLVLRVGLVALIDDMVRRIFLEVGFGVVCLCRAESEQPAQQGDGLQHGPA